MCAITSSPRNRWLRTMDTSRSDGRNRPSWMDGKIVAVANDHGRSHQGEQGEEYKCLCPGAHATPLLQGDPPQGAEDDDARHVQCPAGKLVSAHLRFAH